LGDLIGAGGGAEEARTRVRCAWAKFKEELASVLTSGELLSSERKILEGLYSECCGIYE